MKRFLTALLLVALVAATIVGEVALRRRRTESAPALAEGAYAALGGFRSILAEFIWFRADRLQSEGRYVELAQLASTLTAMEPHTPEIWSYAAWNLAYNVSAMEDISDRWRWVEAGIRLLRDEGLLWNPGDPEICEELAWTFQHKLGLEDPRYADGASPIYRARWREKIADIADRGAWHELKMDPAKMRRIEEASGLRDWSDPCLSAIYWAVEGLPRATGGTKKRLLAICEQSRRIYLQRH